MECTIIIEPITTLLSSCDIIGQVYCTRWADDVETMESTEEEEEEFVTSSSHTCQDLFKSMKYEPFQPTIQQLDSFNSSMPLQLSLPFKVASNFVIIVIKWCKEMVDCNWRTGIQPFRKGQLVVPNGKMNAWMSPEPTEDTVKHVRRQIIHSCCWIKSPTSSSS